MALPVCKQCATASEREDTETPPSTEESEFIETSATPPVHVAAPQWQAVGLSGFLSGWWLAAFV